MRLVNWVRTLLRRARVLPRTARLDRDLQDQIRTHLDEATEEHVRQGLSPSDARRAALLEFGSIVQVEETSRDIRGRWWRDMTKDVRYALRSLARQPAFTIVAVASLAVGIGANTAIFSIVNSILLRPRAVADPDRLVELYTGDRGHPYETTSYPSYAEFRDRNEVFTGLAAYGIRQFKLTGDDHVEQIWGELVSGNYFEVLGVRLAHGRSFGEQDDREGNVVGVIGYGLWQRRFNADQGVVGQTVQVNGQPLTIAGIAPPSYTGMMRGLSTEVWIPIGAAPLLEPANGRRLAGSRGSRWLTLIGRLKPETTVDQARVRFDLLTREMQEKHPEEWKSRQEPTGTVRELFVSVLTERETRIHPSMREGAYATVALLVVIVNLVLLIACMNLAGMLLARAVVRRKEIAMRLALGAGRGRLIRQLVTESVTLSLIAGAAGVMLTVWLLDLLLTFMPSFPEGIRLALDLRLDWRVLVYTAGFSTITGVLFGLVPAMQSSRTDVSAILKDDSTAVSAVYRRSRSRRVLIIAQVAFSLLLLIGAGLVLRSLEKVRPTRLGFSSDSVVIASLTLDAQQYDRARSQDFYRQLTARVAALPGVQSVSLVQDIPGGFMVGSRRSTEIEGYNPGPEETLEIDASFVGPRYFTNMKMSIVQGRDFDERDRDGAPCVAIVNEAFARRYFPAAASALGKHLAKFEASPGPRKQMCEIVGVVRDDRWQSLQNSVRPFYWLPVYQAYRTRMTLLVSTEGDPATTIAPVRNVVRGLDRGVPVADTQTLREQFAMMAYPFRVLGIVMGACGAMALILATIGIYGIVSHSVAQRTREVGIRLALGALKNDILKMVIGQGMALVAWGLALGLLLSVALTRVLSSALFDTGLLFGVSATDSLTFVGLTVVLAVVAALACCIPALRAANVDPIKALRYE
jgi:putative ABC transport system permease protein